MSKTQSTDAAFEPMEQPSLVELAESSLRNAILTGRLRPGARVSDAKIAAEMGISRSPVREAIRRLAVRGLISEQPRRGSFVTQLTRPLVSQVYDCRRALEGLAARRVVESDDAANHVALLSGIVADMGRARTRHDHVGMAEADYRFHLTLCKLTGNAWLIRLYDQLADQIQLMQTVDASAHASSETIDLMMTHGAIVEAIASRDPDAAELAAVTHIDLSEGLFFSEVPDIPDE